MAVRGFRPLEEPFTSEASPFTTSAGPKASASRRPFSSACSEVSLPTISTLSWLKPTTTAWSALTRALFSTLPSAITSPRGLPPLPTPPSSEKPPPLMAATAPYRSAISFSRMPGWELKFSRHTPTATREGSWTIIIQPLKVAPWTW